MCAYKAILLWWFAFILSIPRCCGDFSVSRLSSLVSGGPRFKLLKQQQLLLLVSCLILETSYRCIFFLRHFQFQAWIAWRETLLVFWVFSGKYRWTGHCIFSKSFNKAISYLFVKLLFGYLRELVLIKRSKNYNLRSSSDGLLLGMPTYRSRVTLGDRSFQVAAPALWNVLPREIHSITDLGIFKRYLKTHLFREAFY